MKYSGGREKRDELRLEPNFWDEMGFHGFVGFDLSLFGLRSG
jgi:hypothetical protein